jgi:hypothetical protein
MQLDLPKLVAQVTNHMKQTIQAESVKSAGDEARDQAKLDAKAADDANWLDDKKADWQKDHDKHVRKGASQKDMDKDAKKQPRSANVADLATPGIGVNLPAVTADATMNLRSTDGKMAGDIEGRAQGNGVLRLQSHEIKADVGGNQVDAKDVDTGVVSVSPDMSSAVLNGLSIGSLTWAKSK